MNPAAHLYNSKEHMPGDWFDPIEKLQDGTPKPREFVVRFYYGQAEVEDQVGNYMIKYGLAEKSRLIRPNTWSE